MMRIQSLFSMVLLASVFCISGNVFAVLSGDGTEASPYLIQSRADFDEFANPVNAALYWANGKYTKLMCDLNLSGTTYTQAVIAPDMDSVTSGFQGTNFTGNLNGNHHTISSLTINTPTKDYVGLFGRVGSSGQIRNLGSENVTITGRNFVGGLVGWNDGSLTSCYATGTITGTRFVGGLVGVNWQGITSCHATGTVSGTGDYVGGLVGMNDGLLTSCYATGTVTGISRAGGLAGDNNGSLISCYATGTVSGTGYYVGGLVGANWQGTITFCHATGGVAGTSNYVGGLVGANYASLTSCYATGTVSGTRDCVGGLVGRNDGLLTSCYATGTVTGSDYVGGLVGANYGSLTSCYATGAVTGSDYVGGLVGANYASLTSCFWDTQTGQTVGVGSGPSTGAVGKTTAEMNMLATFTSAGWDFVGESANGLNDYWQMQNNDYPRLMDHAWTLAGEGTAANPYIVANASDLGKVWLKPSACYRLGGNLDLSGTAWSSAVVPAFTGVFDGQGFVIFHLTINQPSSDYIGLFGHLDAGGQIRNLGVENVTITGCECVGGLVGKNDGSLTTCHTTGSVSGTDSVGGLVGRNHYGTLTACYATGSVSGKDSVGGLVGRKNDGTLTACYATGSVTGTWCVGGLVGRNDGSLTACYATGSVSGTGYGVGGLVGENRDSGSLISCYATGTVSGTNDYVGGLVGGNDSGTVTGCFWDIQTSGRVSSSGGSGRTTAEMQMLSTFTDSEWDFSVADGDAADWQIFFSDYPRLAWETRLMTLRKCTVAAGKVLDSISFSGTVNASTERLQSAVSDGNDIVIHIHADDMDNPLAFTFPVNASTFKKGKLTSKTQAGSLSLETKRGKMAFSAKNVNLTGLASPINITIAIGGYTTTLEVKEDIINGAKPCPLPLMQGVKNSLEITKPSFKKGKAAGTDSLTVSGTFTVAGDYKKAPLAITVGSETFTVPVEQMGDNSIAKIASYKPASKIGPLITAKLDYNKCTFTISIKNATIGQSGEVPFGISCFDVNLQGLETIILN